MTPPNVFVLIGDCLRAASVSNQTMPFVSDFTDFSFDQCYSPSTWTLPSHVTLYSQQTPLDHGVTRRGTSLSESQAVLPRYAQESSYQTALFSENPTFSTRLGFEHGIDFVDDFINSKIFVSDFSTEAIVDDVSFGEGIRVLREINSHPKRLRNIANSIYGPFSYFLDSDTEYPHHGEKVIKHVAEYARGNSSEKQFAFVNLLDPHNPHHAPPEPGARALNIEVPVDERKALWAASDTKLYLLDDLDEPPVEARSHFDTWQSIFSREEEIYRSQVRYFDVLIEKWAEMMPDVVLENSLVIVTGDHGQLFGTEGMVGHHTSLHPHGVQVPLFVKTPESWSSTDVTDEQPVSWLGLSHTLGAVTRNDVTSGDEFTEHIVEASTTSSGVIVSADGPTWSVPELRKKYDSDQVDALAVRKIGMIQRDRMDVFESPWEDRTVTHTAFELHEDTRTELPDAEAPDLLEKHKRWLLDEPDDEISGTVSTRLKKLGYL